MSFLYFGSSYPGSKPSAVGIAKDSELWSIQEVILLSSLHEDRVKVSVMKMAGKRKWMLVATLWTWSEQDSITWQLSGKSP